MRTGLQTSSGDGIRVPSHLRDFLHAHEITQSLKTEKRSEAIPLALRWASEVTQIFNEANPSSSLKKHKIEALRDKLQSSNASDNVLLDGAFERPYRKIVEEHGVFGDDARNF